MTRTYTQALNYLYDFINYEHKSAYQYSSDTFQLERFREFLETLGAPHTRFPCVHVAGTKGKGSVAALCESALRAAGYRVGLYTSPHLQDFRERIQVDRELIPEAEFAALVDDIAPVVERVEGLTWFELVTALALLHFARRRVDYAVLEVGLGGRLDATNVVVPRVAAITSISLDHTQLLGNTLAAIAGEKAGIIKPGVPVVSAPQAPEVAAVIARVAAERGAPLLAVDECLDVTLGTLTPAGQDFTVQPRATLAVRAPAAPPAGGLLDGSYTWCIPLVGAHQVVNASVALLVLDALARQGLLLDREAASRGLAGVQWPGRFEHLNRNPLLVIDAAHNPDSAEKLRRTIDALYPEHALTLIFGVSADKDVDAMLRVLVPRARRVILTRATNPRAADPEELADRVAALGVAPEVAPHVDDALVRALDGAGAHDLIVATGSVFVAGAVADVWPHISGARRFQL
jgi:dihydrofolate synthase/folylpolyglutamate synthase